MDLYNEEGDVQMNNYTVYMHVSPSNKKYIGITSQRLKRRWQNGEGYKGQMFYNVIKKYGWDNISHIVIAKGLTEDEAKWLEVELIKVNKTTDLKYGYNVSHGGDSGGHLKGELNPMYGKSGELSPMYGKHLSDDTKRKISEANKGKRLSEEQKQRLSEFKKDTCLSDDTKRKISEAMKGRQFTEEWKRKISESKKGSEVSESTKQKIIEANSGKNSHKAQSVICLTTMTVFDTINEANAYYNISKGSIGKCCSGKKKSAGKYNGEKLIWKYIDIIEL